MKKILIILPILLICLFILTSCKNIKNPHSTNPSEILNLNLPTINHFTAAYQQQSHGCFTLSWSVINAETVSIDQGIGEVSAEDALEVQISKTTIYMLTATNKYGQKTASRTAEVPKWAILEITTIPELPVFTYHPHENLGAPPYWSSSTSEFIIVITETNGVGGIIWSVCLETNAVGKSGCMKRKILSPKNFELYGEVKYLVQISVPCRPTIMTAYFEGYDNNDCKFTELIEIPFVWTN